MKATRKPIPALWLFVLLALAACGQVTNDTRLEPQALILTVTSEADNDSGSLRAAIEQARSGNTITFANNVRTITLSSQLVINKDLTIVGESRVTISGGGNVRVMQVSSGVTLNLDGVTIASGLAGEGGGILNNGTLNVTNSTFLGNAALYKGGGIFNAKAGTLTVTNSTFSENDTGGGGGGIFNDGTLSVTTSTLSGNSASAWGGGIGNIGTLTVINSTFSGNVAYWDGGGILNGGTLNVINSTLSGNSANYGGGTANYGTLNLTNSIVALNTAPSGPDLWTDRWESVTSASHNLIGNTAGSSGITDGENGNIVNSDPKLGSLADNGGPTQTVALLTGSPAIGATLSSSCPATDQRGVARPQGAACDIGAFEKEFIAVTLSVNARGTVSRATGAATVGGSVTCSAPVSVTLNIALSQAQKQGKTTVTVTGSQSVSVSCDGSASWTATVSADSGGFKSGSVSVSATEAGSNPPNQVTQAVSLSWVK